MPYDIPDMFSKPGTPCNDYSGYCDVFQMCREVDPSGPLATLRKLLLSEESIASFKRWVMDYWYAVALIIVTLLCLLVSLKNSILTNFAHSTISKLNFFNLKIIIFFFRRGKKNNFVTFGKLIVIYNIIRLKRRELIKNIN